MQYLIPMTDFVTDQEQLFNKGIIGFKEFTNNICNYNKFLKTPLTIGIFVPCNNNGNLLKEPKGTNLNNSFSEMVVDCNLKSEYQKAKNNCLFEDFKFGFRIDEAKVFVVDNFICDEEETIENLLQYKERTFILSETAKELINH